MYFSNVELASNTTLTHQKDLSSQRGELAVRQARINYLEGQALYGDGSWERSGSNKGPLLTPMNKSNGASGREGYEWCGMYVGHAHAKAGIRPEILRANVFWSGHRLHLYFMKGVDVRHKKIGNFWQPHKTLSLHGLKGQRRKKALDGFKPRAGDIALFHANYTHVGIVDSYNSETGELMILEGNSGNRVRATTYDTGEGGITFIGRFNSSDYGPSVDEKLFKKGTPEVNHDDRKSSRTR
jgi:hypothetical protein